MFALLGVTDIGALVSVKLGFACRWCLVQCDANVGEFKLQCILNQFTTFPAFASKPFFCFCFVSQYLHGILFGL
jgi:hypothetical protein